MATASGAFSIEYFMAAKDPFRQAPGKKIPVPWPFDSRPGSQKAQEIVQNLQSSYEKILKEYGITLHQVRVQSLGRRACPTERKDTLIILTRDV